MYVLVIIALITLSFAAYDRVAAISASDPKFIQQCGTWGIEYSAQHSKMISGDGKDKKFLVAVPHSSGLADRMVGLGTMFMLSLMSGRIFQIGRREGLPNLEMIFDSPNLNWTRPADPWWVVEPVTHKQRVNSYNSSVLESQEYCSLSLIENIRKQDEVLTKDAESLLSHEGKGLTRTAVVSANKGLLSRYAEVNSVHRNRLKRMGLDTYNSFGCIINYLFQPKPEIFAPLRDQHAIMTSPHESDRNRTLRIGIQIRVGDWAWGDRNHSVNLNVDFYTFFSCAQQIEDFVLKAPDSNYSSAIWYLTTESLPLRIAAVEQYGSRKVVTALNVSLDHSAKERSVCHRGDCAVNPLSFMTAAAEWWLLGEADYHVITRNSGYGRSAGFRSLHRDRIYTVHSGRAARVCDKDSYTQLENHSYDWSGI